MTAPRPPVPAIAVWIAAVVLIGAVGIIRHDDDSKVAANSPTTPDTSVTVPVPDTTLPADTTPGGVPAETTAPPATEPAVPSGVLAPAPGAYPTDVTGSVTFPGAGVFPAPTEGEVLVEQLEGNDQRITLPLGPGLLSTVLRYRPDSIDLVSTDLVIAVSKTFIPPAPVTYMPASPQPGQQWQWPLVSTDGLTTGTYTATVTDPGTVDVGGTSVPVVVVDTVMQFDPSSDVQGHMQLTMWYSLADRLPVQTHLLLELNYGGGDVSLTSDITSTLTTLTPS